MQVSTNTPDDSDRMVPNPARKTAAARIRRAAAAVQAAETARDAALLQLPSPAPGQAACLTNQVINALAAPVEDAWRDLDEAGQAAAAIPARIPLGTLAPDMVRLGAETNPDHPRHSDGRIQRRVHPGPRPGRPLHPRRRRGMRPDPRGTDHLRRHLPRPRPAPHQARLAHRAPARIGLGRAVRPAHRRRRLLSATDLVLRHEVKSHPIPAQEIPMSGVLILETRGGSARVTAAGRGRAAVPRGSLGRRRAGGRAVAGRLRP